VRRNCEVVDQALAHSTVRSCQVSAAPPPAAGVGAGAVRPKVTAVMLAGKGICCR
jgi:hypothetical protein